MSEAKKSLFEGNLDWKERAFEVLDDSSIEYDRGRVEQFIKRVFAYKGSLDKNLKPARDDFGAFTDKVLAAGIEDAARHQDNEELYARRIAEIALVMDGLYGVDYPELGRIYRDSLTAIRREGSYTVWRSTIGRVVGSVREDFETSVSEVDVVQRLETEEKPIVGADAKKKVSVRSGTNKREYKSAVEPDYADIEDVIKYLYQAALVSPSHAAALMVALGYQRPQGVISDELKNDMQRIRNDLRARIVVREEQKLTAFEQTGVRIISAFLQRSPQEPNLQLFLDDTDMMLAVGSELVNLHKLDDLRRGAPRERTDKYDGMGAIIDFTE